MTLAKAGAIKLVTERCSRGEGRQIAFENSSGDYIVAHMDMDDTFKPSLISLLELYHQRCEGNLLLAIFNAKKQLRGVQNIIISTRELMASLGGWRDLQRFEDWDLWSRAAKIGKYCWTEFPLLDTWNRHPERRNFRQNLKFRYLRMHACSYEDEFNENFKHAGLLLVSSELRSKPLDISEKLQSRFTPSFW